MRIARKLPSVIYRWTVIFLAYWFVSYLFHMLDLDLTGDMIFLLCMGVLAEWFSVTFPQGQLSATFAVVFSSYVIFGPAGAVWITALGCLLGQVMARSNSLPTVLFNASQYVLAIAGGDFVYMYLGGAGGERLAWGNILPLAGFVLTCFVLNQMLVYLYLLPERKNNPLVFWRDALKWDGLTYLITTPFGALMAVVYASLGLWGVLFLFLPVLVMQLVLRLYVHLELANRELRALYEVAGRLGGKLSVDEILGVILKEARRVVRYHTGLIYLWSEEKDCYEARVIEGPYRDRLKGSLVLPGQEFLGCLAQSGEPAIVYDSRRDPRVNIQPGLTQVHKSLLVIPLVSKQEVLGLFVLGDKRPFVFDENHLQVFSAIAGQAAVAVANDGLNRRLNRYTEVTAKTDTLTGLYNRQYFLECLGKELGNGSEDNPVSIILVDIDHLARVNHSYGYAVGDSVLALVGRTISHVIGSRGVVARFDGEEFAVILPGVGEVLACKLAESIRQAVANSAVESSGDYYRVQVSSGVACYPGDAGDMDGLLCRAEQALRRAKDSGRNCSVVYSLKDLPGVSKKGPVPLFDRKKGVGV